MQLVKEKKTCSVIHLGIDIKGAGQQERTQQGDKRENIIDLWELDYDRG